MCVHSKLQLDNASWLSTRCLHTRLALINIFVQHTSIHRFTIQFNSSMHHLSAPQVWMARCVQQQP